MKYIKVEACEAGMVAARDVLSGSGVPLIRAGSVIQEKYIKILIEHRCLGLYVYEAEDGVGKGTGTPLKVKENKVISHALHDETVKILRGVFTDIKHMDQRAFKRSLKGVNRLLDEIIDQIINNQETSFNIQALKSFDEYTYQHSVDVSILAVLIGKELRLKRAELVMLGISAMFHDIGKTMVPISILNKPDKLTDEEFAEIKKHTTYGYGILTRLEMPDEVCQSALSHHERLTGRGYPQGLKAEEIPFFAKILAVADTYDAMSAKRVYKEGIPPAEVYEYLLRNVDEHFDETVVRAFLGKVAPELLR